MCHIHCNNPPQHGWHSTFPTREGAGTAKSGQYHPCSLTASHKMLPVMFSKHLEVMWHGCNMTQMSLYKYHCIMSRFGAKSLAHSLQSHEQMES